MRKAVVRLSDGLVVNVVLVDDESSWSPPEGCRVVDGPDASLGDTWDGARFIKPVPVPPKPWWAK